MLFRVCGSHIGHTLPIIEVRPPKLWCRASRTGVLWALLGGQFDLEFVHAREKFHCVVADAEIFASEFFEVT